MKFPEKYIKRGRFVLHSGQKSNIFYDLEEMITDNHYFRHIQSYLPSSKHYVGIATGGLIIATMAHTKYPSHFSYVRNGQLVGSKPRREWTLIDDIVSTGASLREAIALCESEPENIFVILDKRKKNENPKVRALYHL